MVILIPSHSEHLELILTSLGVSRLSSYDIRGSKAESLNSEWRKAEGDNRKRL